MLNVMLYSFVVAVELPPIIADIPLAPADLFVYLLVGASIYLLIRFGMKKPKGPSDAGQA